MAPSIGIVRLGEVPRIAVPLLDDAIESDVAAVRGLTDLIELRIDGFADRSPAGARRAIGAVRGIARDELPIIATVRAAAEGGMARLEDEERAAIYEEAMPLVDAVDIELDAAVRDRVLARARRHGKTAIVSHHDFARMPTEGALDELVARGRAAGADILKIAAAAACIEDLRVLLGFTLRHRDTPLVTVAMGEPGAASRVFFFIAGSLITYGCHRTASAPGQMPLRELRDELARYYPDLARRRPPAR